MITINNLKFSYSKKERLFEELDLNISPGKICGLLGKNGAGKTTLLRNIAGLLFPKEGSIEVMNSNVVKRDPDFLKEIFYVQEEFELPNMKVNLYQKLNSPFYEKFDNAKFDSILNDFDVDPNKKIGSLSFGQRKKVQVAFALATGVKLLLLDEPTNGLDIPSKSQFRKVIISSIEEDQVVIISSHQVRDLTNLLDHIIIVDDGKIILNEDVFDISTKLEFTKVESGNIPEDALYDEMIPGGSLVVIPNITGAESQIDIEALFNAAVLNKGKINQLFNS